MPNHANTRNIFFIRHGESESNVQENLAAGYNYNSPLTSLGKDQAKALGKRFKREGIFFDLIFTSKLSRAIETAELFLAKSGNQKVPIKRSEKLNELQVPAWRGKERSKMMTIEVEAAWGKNGKLYTPADGESEYEMQKRFANYIDDEIIFNQEIQQNQSKLNIAVVAHGWAFRCYFQSILEYDQTFIHKMAMHNTSISQFKYNEQGWGLIRINDSSHLESIDTNSRRYK
jgi:broad specificity phosphatase PhoE